MTNLRQALLAFTTILAAPFAPLTAAATCDPPCTGQICCSDGSCTNTVSACGDLTWELPSSQFFGDNIELVIHGKLRVEEQFIASVLLTARDPDLDVNEVFSCRTPVNAEIACFSLSGAWGLVINYQSFKPYLLATTHGTGETFHFPLSSVVLRNRDIPTPQ